MPICLPAPVAWAKRRRRAFWPRHSTAPKAPRPPPATRVNCAKASAPATTSTCWKSTVPATGASTKSANCRQNVAVRPSRARYKIYIIDEVHMLTKEAFNALLKTLEEPPEHVKFIFATTEPNKIPVTILSRCQRYDFGRHRSHCNPNAAAADRHCRRS